MKNKIIAIAAVSALLVSAGVYAEDGAALFKSKGCAACHHPTNDQTAKGLGNSIAQVKAAYGSDKAGLINFLKGNDQPKLDAKKYKQIMKAQLANIKSLPDSSIAAIADFLLK